MNLSVYAPARVEKVYEFIWYIFYYTYVLVFIFSKLSAFQWALDYCAVIIILQK